MHQKEEADNIPKEEEEESEGKWRFARLPLPTGPLYGGREGGEGAAKLFLKGEKGKERGRLFRESAISRRRRRREIRRGMRKNPDLFRRKIVGFRTIFPPFSPASREEGNFARETQREKSLSFSPSSVP